MDWYGYFLAQLRGASNPYTAMERCEVIAADLYDNPHIPTCATLSVAADLLAAVTDFAGNGCTVSPSFRRVRQLMTDICQRMQSACRAEDLEWHQEQHDMSGVPVFEPCDYEVRDEDVADEEPDDWQDMADLTELYGSGGEPGTTGTRRPFPDWEHISDWSATDWMKLRTYKDKVLAAAEAGFMGVSSVAGVLSSAKGAMTEIPLPQQVELCMWATEVVDGLMFSLEDDLQKMCSGSLHSHEGRLVQKQLLSGTTKHPENTAI